MPPLRTFGTSASPLPNALHRLPQTIRLSSAQTRPHGPRRLLDMVYPPSTTAAGQRSARPSRTNPVCPAATTTQAVPAPENELQAAADALERRPKSSRTHSRSRRPPQGHKHTPASSAAHSRIPSASASAQSSPLIPRGRRLPDESVPLPPSSVNASHPTAPPSRPRSPPLVVQPHLAPQPHPIPVSPPPPPQHDPFAVRYYHHAPIQPYPGSPPPPPPPGTFWYPAPTWSQPGSGHHSPAYPPTYHYPTPPMIPPHHRQVYHTPRHGYSQPPHDVSEDAPPSTGSPSTIHTHAHRPSVTSTTLSSTLPLSTSSSNAPSITASSSTSSVPNGTTTHRVFGSIDDAPDQDGGPISAKQFGFGLPEGSRSGGRGKRTKRRARSRVIVGNRDAVCPEPEKNAKEENAVYVGGLVTPNTRMGDEEMSQYAFGSIDDMPSEPRQNTNTGLTPPQVDTNANAATLSPLSASLSLPTSTASSMSPAGAGATKEVVVEEGEGQKLKQLLEQLAVSGDAAGEDDGGLVGVGAGGDGEVVNGSGHEEGKDEVPSADVFEVKDYGFGFGPHSRGSGSGSPPSFSHPHPPPAHSHSHSHSPYPPPPITAAYVPAYVYHPQHQADYNTGANGTSGSGSGYVSPTWERERDRDFHGGHGQRYSKRLERGGEREYVGPLPPRRGGYQTPSNSNSNSYTPRAENQHPHHHHHHHPPHSNAPYASSLPRSHPASPTHPHAHNGTSPAQRRPRGAGRGGGGGYHSHSHRRGANMGGGGYPPPPPPLSPTQQHQMPYYAAAAMMGMGMGVPMVSSGGMYYEPAPLLPRHVGAPGNGAGAGGAPTPVPITQLGFPLDTTRYYLLGQLEYYLSAQNMAQDYFLRQRLDSSGFVPIALIASFNRVRRLTEDVELVREVLTLSGAVEVRGEWVRMKDWRAFVLPGARASEVDDEGEARSNGITNGVVNGQPERGVDGQRGEDGHGAGEAGTDEEEEEEEEEEDDEDDVVFVLTRED
ncbi:hypothetical protein H0H87_011917 [Tephrocybe sp. NHM501043]|nr:hypothetical protein H0H87_011917 [Tephrocybe sp. NHM501043]